MNYTSFGEYFRILRIKNHEVMADAANFLGVSTAFISSVECGKKPIPSNWKEKIILHYNLDENDSKLLTEAIDYSQTNVKIDLSSINKVGKSVAIQFQRSFNDIDDESMLEIQKILDNLKK